MKVITLTKFVDIKESVTREKGDVFECSDERYREIMAVRDDLVACISESDGTQDPDGDEGSPDDGTQNPDGDEQKPKRPRKPRKKTSEQ